MSNLQSRLDRYREAVEMVDRGEARELTVRAVGLLREGVLPSDMAERLGRARASVYQALNDSTDERNRARKRKRYGTCKDCGAHIFNSGSEPGERCVDCERSRNAERNDRLRELWEAGAPTAEIATKLGMTETAVRAWVVSARLCHDEPLTLRRRRDRELWPELERLWNAGVPIDEIAEQLDANAPNLYVMVSAMRARGIEMADRVRHWDAELIAELREVWNGGASVREVGEHFGLTYHATRKRIQILRQQGHELAYRRQKVAA